jgi:DNA mismatch repair protein MutS
VILAQMGSYVPADSAKIGVVDKVFSRVGASDDLARGRSTFMVEMVEVATILNNATAHSLVILDEVGRGTATYDGLSIAWAVVEYLHDKVKARALFATHYHELTGLTGRLKNLSLHTMKTKEWQGDVVFLHEVTEGAVARSYGIHVAKLAGLPNDVVSRAETILGELEEKKKAQKPLFDDLPLFSAVATPTYNNMTESKALKHLKEIDVDALSPREALSLLYNLKKETEE